MNVLICR